MEETKISFNLPYSVKSINSIEPIEAVVGEVKEEIKEEVKEVKEEQKIEIKEELKIKDDPNFSIVFITKNNENSIENLLKKLEDFKDNGGDISILDLGSTDNTIKIATALGAKIENGSNFFRTVDNDMSNVINQKFKKDQENIINDGDIYIDYSAARDYAATLSNNDNILMIDASSYFVEFNYKLIKEQITGREYDRLIFTSHNKNSNVAEFYNRRKYKWNGIVNEKLVANQQPEKTLNVSESSIRIQFLDTKENSEYYVGLAVNCFLFPTEEHLKIFGKKLYEKKLLSSAIDLFYKSLSTSQNNIEKAQILDNLGDCLFAIQRKDEAIDCYNKSFKELSWRTPIYKLGQYYFQSANWQKCIYYLELCLLINRPDGVKEDEFYYADGPYSMLYVAYWWNGDPKKGKFHFDKALEINPYNPIYLNETKYHYEYEGNTIQGFLTFQETQHLYKEAKKHKTILEIFPENGRGTHSLLNGTDGLVTVLLKSFINVNEFVKSLDNPGNLRIVMEDEFEIIKNEKFDMSVINFRDQNSDDIKRLLFNWEYSGNKILIGYDYNNTKEDINANIEISGTLDNMWYRKVNQFEKIVIYKRKNIN